MFVNDDVLFEILVRVSDFRSLIKASLVCKRWHSLIHDDFFKNKFVEFHRNTPKLSEYFVHCSEFIRAEPRTFYQIPISETKAIVPCDLSFVSAESGDLIIRATCGDLVLLSRGSRHLFVCNWLTKQFIALPEIPPIQEFHPFYDLFNLAGSLFYIIAFNQRSYKVAILCHGCFEDEGYTFRTITFDPETSEWKFKFHVNPYEHVFLNVIYKYRVQGVLFRGVLFWLDGVRKIYALVAFDPFSHESRVIGLPDRFSDVETREIGFCDKFRLGVVRGRLRVSQSLKTGDDGSRFELLIWELDTDNGDSWELVHEVVLETEASVLFLLNFDPNNGDVVFLVKDREIFSYHIGGDKYERVSEFPALRGESIDVFKTHVASNLNVYTLEYPAWPTPVSSVLLQ